MKFISNIATSYTSLISNMKNEWNSIVRAIDWTTIALLLICGVSTVVIAAIIGLYMYEAFDRLYSLYGYVRAFTT